MYEKIVVPLDGSNAAEIALPYAGEIAANFNSQITLVSVSEPGTPDVGSLYRSYLKRITEQLRSRLQDYGAGKTSKVNSKILSGEPAQQILDYADDNNTNLLIIANRGASSRQPWLLGNVAAKVLRATNKPVLLIRVPAGNVALRKKQLIKRILVPLDGSKLGEAAIPYVEQLAKSLDAEIVLFQVGESITVSGGFDDGVFYAKPTPQDLDKRKAFGIAYLDGVGKPLRKQGLEASSVLVMGHAAEQIMNYAEDNAIDLVALSSHGRSGMGRWVFGSVTDKVIHTGDIPVLVVHPNTK